MAIGAQVWRALASGGTRRQMIGTALAGLILGLGSVTAGTGMVQASERRGLFDFFEALFHGPAKPQAAPAPRPPGRYANLPDGRRLAPARPLLHTPRLTADLAPWHAPRRRQAARRRAIREATDAGTGQRTVCVRMCDGYLFPLGNLRAQADMPVHRSACAAACPGAATSVYTLAAEETDLDRAVSPQGLPYKASALANIYRQRRVADCACRPAGGAVPLPVADDSTLRRGDVVATLESADVVTRVAPGFVALVDFRRAQITLGRTRQIEARIGALRRDEQARAFRRILRAAGREGVFRVASAEPAARIPERAAFTAVRVVAPSPFRP